MTNYTEKKNRGRNLSRIVALKLENRRLEKKLEYHDRFPEDGYRRTSKRQLTEKISKNQLKIEKLLG